MFPQSLNFLLGWDLNPGTQECESRLLPVHADIACIPSVSSVMYNCSSPFFSGIFKTNSYQIFLSLLVQTKLASDKDKGSTFEGSFSQSMKP